MADPARYLGFVFLVVFVLGVVILFLLNSKTKGKERTINKEIPKRYYLNPEAINHYFKKKKKKKKKKK